MNLVLISDLHLTDKEEDKYRFEVFDLLKHYGGENKKLIVLGDITEKKDKHSSDFVERIVINFKALSEYFSRIEILRGNHDHETGVSILSILRYVADNIIFHDTPLYGKDYFFIPDKYPIESERPNYKPKYLFLHHSLEGALNNNGIVFSDGVPFNNKDFKDTAIFSGHIHVPQTLSNGVTYVGSPYHINFGDTFKPRFIVINDKGEVQSIDLSEAFPAKFVIDVFFNESGIIIETIPEYNLRKIKEAILKFKIYLEPSNYDKYNNIIVKLKEMFDGYNIQKFSLVKLDTEVSISEVKTKQHKDFFKLFIEKNNIPYNIRDIAKELMDEDDNENRI